MKTILTLSIAVISLIFLSATMTTQISYKEINTKYQIMGPLGLPLGKVAELEVQKIETHTKADPPTFKIISLNGKKIDKSFTMTYRTLIISDKFENGKTYTIKAYQDGVFTGTPDEVLKDVMIQTSQYNFDVELAVYKIL
ncbi:MAG: hypothetical protein HY958_04930 [Bacteroidia bacterium]|nr:hypothetical protein [Bacteroidia bacterium]